MVNRLSAEEVIGQDLFRDRNEGAVRNKLREYFGIATVVKTRLEVPPSLAEKPLWSAPIKGHAHSLALSPEGKMLAVGHARDGVFLLDGATGVRVADLPAKGEYLRVQFRKSDGHLLTFNMMKSLAEWDVAGRKLLREQSLKTSPLNDIVFSDSCDMIAGGSANEPSVSVMDLKTGTLRWTQPMRIRGFALIALSPDDRCLAVCDGFSKTIMLWDTASPNPIARLEGHAGVPGRARFSPDGAWLISTGDDEKILLWDGRTGALRHEYTGSVARFNAVAFTADSQRFIACPAHGKFGVFDCATGQATHGFTVPGNWVSEMSVSADGTRLFMLVVRSDGLGTHESRVDCWSLAETK